ncbi:hypothetical protein WI87_30845 [Burkholderia ubonensis]|nr:hypothetical protein WI87_30845 [Burkholderia ubonensis]
MLRECNSDGQICYLDMSAYDELILEQCTTHWQLAARVVGITMSKLDPRNGQSDAFLFSRLQQLIDDGRVVVDGPRTNMRAYRVRRC